MSFFPISVILPDFLLINLQLIFSLFRILMIIKSIVTSRQSYGGVRESSAFEKFNTHLAFMMMLNADSSEFQTSISNLKQNLNTLDVRELCLSLSYRDWRENALFVAL